jgi:hypothetical protein
MKLKYTYLLYLLLVSISAFSQPKKGTATHTATSNPKAPTIAAKSEISGVWRGFFTSGSGFFQEKYKYEVQVGQLTNNGIKGVTYSYKTTVFYGKANLAGMYTPSTKNLVLKENKLVEVKMTSGDACLMTCYLEYSKVGNTEILEGTFTSVNVNDNNRDCGSGRVYLEKVPESDFFKEDFVKEFEAKKKNSTTKPTPKASTTTAKTNTTPKKDVVVKSNPAPKPKPKTIEAPAKDRKRDDLVTVSPSKPNPSDRKIETVDVKPAITPNKPLPKELKERENTVTKTIHAEGDEIEIQLYDNGQIDDDTVTVYHNKQVVAWKKRLCHQPITIKVKVDPNHPRNEFVMVADNLGTIPPNTALMKIIVGKQHFDVNLTSTEKKNAAVIIDCKVPSRESK